MRRSEGRTHGEQADARAVCLAPRLIFERRGASSGKQVSPGRICVDLHNNGDVGVGLDLRFERTGQLPGESEMPLRVRNSVGDGLFARAPLLLGAALCAPLSGQRRKRRGAWGAGRGAYCRSPPRGRPPRRSSGPCLPRG